jgi:hypothetical protein
MIEIDTPSRHERPALTASLEAAELRRWYWTMEELAGLARLLVVPVTGPKLHLLARLSAALDGEEAPMPSTQNRSTGCPQLSGRLTRDTVIPAGQRCSQELRALRTGDRSAAQV